MWHWRKKKYKWKGLVHHFLHHKLFSYIVLYFSFSYTSLPSWYLEHVTIRTMNSSSCFFVAFVNFFLFLSYIKKNLVCASLWVCGLLHGWIHLHKIRRKTVKNHEDYMRCTYNVERYHHTKYERCHCCGKMLFFCMSYERIFIPRKFSIERLTNYTHECMFIPYDVWQNEFFKKNFLFKIIMWCVKFK